MVEKILSMYAKGMTTGDIEIAINGYICDSIFTAQVRY